jgi:hypothetical protein
MERVGARGALVRGRRRDRAKGELSHPQGEGGGAFRLQDLHGALQRRGLSEGAVNEPLPFPGVVVLNRPASSTLLLYSSRDVDFVTARRGIAAATRLGMRTMG